MKFNSILFKIIPLYFAIVSAAILAIPGEANVAHAQSIDVAFEQTPLFNQANFLPGEAVTRTISVSNLSDSTQEARLRTIDEAEDGTLAEVLSVSIVRDNGDILYNDSLENLFDLSHVLLGEISSKDSATYSITVTFNPDAGNTYQNDIAEFSLCIGFAGHNENCVTDGGTGSPGDTGGSSGSGGDDDDNSSSGGSLIKNTGDNSSKNMDDSETTEVDFGKLLKALFAFITESTEAGATGDPAFPNTVGDLLPPELFEDGEVTATTSTLTKISSSSSTEEIEDALASADSSQLAAAFLASISWTEGLMLLALLLFLALLARWFFAWKRKRKDEQ